MLYNDIIDYNHVNITYSGILYINVPSISTLITVNNITVVISTEADYSNATAFGLVTYDMSPSGIITIEATQDQATAISGAAIVYLVPSSESTLEVTQDQTAAISGTSMLYLVDSSEVTMSIIEPS